ncbi:MAG: hypothetical protein ACRDQ7_19010 [Haloechinothrix sp.]
MIAALTVLQEMTALALTRPGINASADSVADWQERRAAMLEHIAAAGGPDANHAHQLAARARRRAAELTANQRTLTRP